MSVYGDILKALKAKISATAGLPTPGALRDTPILFPGETIPVILIIPAADQGEMVKKTFFGNSPTPGSTGTVVWRYPVRVILITAGDRLPETNLLALLDQRELLRNTIFVPKLGDLASAFDVTIDPRAPADLQATAQSEYRVAGFIVRYDSQEDQRWI